MPTEQYFADFPEFRRFREGDIITPGMRQAAINALSFPLRHVIDHPGYRIVLETHKSEAKGIHKGATILFPKTA
jgi:hypothetical protein